MEDGQNEERENHDSHGVDEKWASASLLHQGYGNNGGKHVNGAGTAHHPFNHVISYASVFVHEGGIRHHLGRKMNC